MDETKKIKLLTQLLPCLVGVLCFIAFYIFLRCGNTQMADVFLGVALGLGSIALVNVLVIHITHRSEIKVQDDFKNDIAKKTTAIVLGNIKLDSEAFEDVIKQALEQKQEYERINILALKGRKFLKALKKANFKCDTLSIFLQTKISTNKKLFKKTKDDCKKLRGKIKNIVIVECKEDTDKLLYGMTMGSDGVIGFYYLDDDNLPHVKPPLRLSGDKPHHALLLDVVNHWYDYYKAKLSTDKPIINFSEDSDSQP